MNTKICTKCHEEKNIDTFPFKNKKKGTKLAWCLPCDSKRKKDWKLNGPKHSKASKIVLISPEITKKICPKCKEEKDISFFSFRNKEKKYRTSYCKSCEFERKKTVKYKGIIPESKICNECKISKITKDNFYWDNSKNNYFSICKNCVYLNHSVYKKQNKETIRNYRKKVQENPHERIRTNVQNRFSILKTGYKSKTFVKMIGCTLDFFITWLEFQFYDGMNIHNYGKIWHIDHCIPCNKFDLTNEEQVKKCFHWSNLRPLLCSKNLRKSDKIIYHDILMQELKVKVFSKSLNINPGHCLTNLN